MIDKPLDQIDFDDIDAFVQESQPESKSVEYKRESYGSADADKKELLKDVSSFANTQGGDIYIGVDEDKGLPVSAPGIAVADVDAEKLRLEGIIRGGLEPRIDFAIHSVTTPSSTTILIVRISESLLAPHRVTFRGRFGEFWGRSSAGKFSMDTDELRRAFTLSDSVFEQIRQFRQNRVMHVISDETPVPLMPGGKLLLHLIPVASFRSRQRFDTASMPDLSTKFPPAGTSSWDHRINLDGHVSYSVIKDESGCRTYSQFFRNGIVEAVLSEVVQKNERGENLLLAGHYEHTLTQRFGAFDQFLSGMKDIGIQPPIWCFLSLVGVKGVRISTSGHFPDERRDIDRDVLLLPESVIDDLDVKPADLLRPMFDLVWNASGFMRSLNFDDTNDWVGR